MTQPSYVAKLPRPLQTKWNSINTSFGTNIADGWLNRTLDEQKQQIDNQASMFSTVKFELDKSSGEFISQSENGDMYVSFMLSDIFQTRSGRAYSEELMQKWADDINSGSMIVGDIDHAEYDKILNNYVDENIIKSKLKEKGGIARAVKAIYEKGKLWVKALIDKKYKRAIEKAKGVSLEAFVNEGNLKTEGDLLGFTFVVNKELENPRAKISK